MNSEIFKNLLGHVDDNLNKYQILIKDNLLLFVFSPYNIKYEFKEIESILKVNNIPYYVGFQVEINELPLIKVLIGKEKYYIYDISKDYVEYLILKYEPRVMES